MTGWLKPDMPSLGMDFAGEIDALGDGATGFAVGDRVFGLSPDTFGAHAEYICVPADGAVAKLPGDVAFDAAVVCEGAWYAHATTAVLGDGQSILVYGASGAIGTAAVQLAKIRGAEVTAVVATRHLDLARSLGADRVIDYTAEDFTVLPERFDVVFDAVGKTSVSQCRKLLAPQGVYAATDLGPYWSTGWLSMIHAVLGIRRVRIPFPEDAPGFVQDMQSYLGQGLFRGVIDRHFALENIVDAFRYVETGQKTGIVVVDV
jgi:NADPH:quinone reductase-like Zn-dependent oxidoreductase